MKKSLTVTALALAVALFALAPTLEASTISYEFTTANFAVKSDVPYGTVTLTDVTGGVQFDITLDTNLFMILDGFGFSSSGLDQELLDIDSPYGGWKDNGNGHMDGFGTFNYIIEGPNWGQGGSANHLTFVVGHTGATAETLLSDNGSGHLFAAHVYDTLGVTNAQTGFITGGTTPTPTPVPEPASMLLLGTGLLGAGFLRRRRNR